MEPIQRVEPHQQLRQYLPLPLLGTTTYYVSQSVGSCESPRSAIVVNVAAAVCATPAPTVSSPVNYTVGATASALTAIGTNLKWYAAASGGTALASAPVPSTSVAGTTSYFVSQTLNNCEGPRAELKVMIAGCSTPAPTVSSPVNYNVGATALPLTATGTNLKWYAASAGGTALASAPVPSTSVAATTSYFVSQTLNNCEGPRAEIVVIVASCATVAPTVVNPATYCFNATRIAFNRNRNGTQMVHSCIWWNCTCICANSFYHGCRDNFIFCKPDTEWLRGAKSRN